MVAVLLVMVVLLLCCVDVNAIVGVVCSIFIYFFQVFFCVWFALMFLIFVVSPCFVLVFLVCFTFLCFLFCSHFFRVVLYHFSCLFFFLGAAGNIFLFSALPDQTTALSTNQTHPNGPESSELNYQS